MQGSLMDYFIGGGSCQGLIPFDKGLWLASDDFNWVYELIKPRIRVILHFWYKLKIRKILLLPYMQGEIKIIDTQKKTATAIIVKSRIDIEMGNQIQFKRFNHPG